MPIDVGIGRKLVRFTAIWVLVRRSPERVLPASPDAGSARDRGTVAELTELSSDRSARMRIAVISMHTSPTAPLGQQAAGGMNVYVREVCSAFSDRGIATDVFTRVQSDDDPRIEQLAPLSRVIYLDAGRDLDKYSLYREVPQFASRIFNHVLAEDAHYDLIYSHYWLSGEVACVLRPRLAPAWAHTAHTLGLVKNQRLASGARPEPPLRIAVEGEMERLKGVASAAGVRAAVEFVGSVAHHELPYFYAAADVCVMPSYSESFGLVGLEAQACGCPVVASDVSGLRSVARDGVTGFLVAGDDPAVYAERIARLLDDPELARQMGRRGQLLAQRFSWSRTADRLAGLFSSLAERKAASTVDGGRAHSRLQAGMRHE